MKKIALIGCGAIGSVIVDAIARREIEAELVALMDMHPDRCVSLAKKISEEVEICKDLECVIGSKPHIVVEAASQEAVREYVPALVGRGIDVVVLSVGALLEKRLLNELIELSRRSKARIYVPSGAVAGIDAIKAIAIVGAKKVVLRTTKNVKAFDPNTLKQLGIDPNRITHRTVVFQGPASIATKMFPANINVVATLALASGVEPQVEIYADPEAESNVHEIEVESDVSKIYIKVVNRPHPQNPRTSYIAALSVIKLLKQLCNNDTLYVGV